MTRMTAEEYALTLAAKQAARADTDRATERMREIRRQEFESYRDELDHLRPLLPTPEVVARRKYLCEALRSTEAVYLDQMMLSRTREIAWQCARERPYREPKQRETDAPQWPWAEIPG